MDSAPTVEFDRVVWRVDSKPYQRDSSPTKWSTRFVPYITAPIVAGLLDGWVSPENWWDTYEDGPAPGTLWCNLSINTGDPEFEQTVITKRDLGVAPSGNNELAMKGMVSDAFKRAAIMKWGVGRNVYELPSLWAPCKESKEKAYWHDEHTSPELKRQLDELGFTFSGPVPEGTTGGE